MNCVLNPNNNHIILLSLLLIRSSLNSDTIIPTWPNCVWFILSRNYFLFRMFIVLANINSCRLICKLDTFIPIMEFFIIISVRWIFVACSFWYIPCFNLPIEFVFQLKDFAHIFENSHTSLFHSVFLVNFSYFDSPPSPSLSVRKHIS